MRAREYGNDFITIGGNARARVCLRGTSGSIVLAHTAFRRGIDMIEINREHNRVVAPTIMWNVMNTRDSISKSHASETAWRGEQTFYSALSHLH